MAYVTRRHTDHTALPFPHKCCICHYGGENRDFYLDTGLNTEWDGAFILCSECIPPLLMGAYGFNPLKALEDHILSHKDQDMELEAARDYIVTANAALANLGLTLEGVINLGRAAGSYNGDSGETGPENLDDSGQDGELGEVIRLFSGDSSTDDEDSAIEHGSVSSGNDSDDEEASGEPSTPGIVFDFATDFHL